MKILQLIDSDGLYGAERVLLALSSGLQRRGWSVTLGSIASAADGARPVETAARELGFAVQRFGMVRGPSPAGAASIATFAARQGIPLVHSHGYRADVLSALGKLLRRNIARVSTVHGWTAVQPGSRLEWYESAGRVALRFLDAVVTVSDELYRDQRLSHIRHDRLHRVINGIDGPPPEKREQVVRRLAGDSNTRLLGEFVSAHRIIGYVGRLSAEKNPLVLLESLRILREQGKDVRLLMIGDGALKAEILHAARRLNVAQDVLLTGFRADARALMPVMDVIALSSLTEGLPVVLLEAMHAQVPVIAPAVGGICELLNGGAAGVLLRSVTPQDLADGIRSVLDDDALRDRIVCEATRVIEQRFTVGAMTDAYEQIYAGVLVRRRPGLQSRQGDGPVE